jgi:site-specific recombinase XerC
VPSTHLEKPEPVPYPGWFTHFLADRTIRKPSPHTAKAYRQDFEAIARLIAGSADGVAAIKIADLTADTLRAAFAVYAENHSAASIRRCWSTWNTLCTFLYTSELLAANPMPMIGRPTVPKSLPKSYSTEAIARLVAALDADDGSTRRTDWAERDSAIVFTSLGRPEGR